MVFLAIMLNTGVGDHLFIVTIPFGIISMLLSKWHFKEFSKDPNSDIRLMPFSSHTEIRRLRKKASGFRAC